MYNFTWGATEYEVAFLIKQTAFNKMQIENNYKDLPYDKLVALSLDYGGKKKPSAKTANDYIPKLLKSVDMLKIETIYCADSEYFKKLTKQTKAEPHLGAVLDCAWKGFEHIKVILGVNYQSLLYDPKNRQKLALSLSTLSDHLEGTHTVIGSNIIKYENYPSSYEAIEAALAELHQYPVLSADIEAFSLFFGDAGVGTIGFAWNKNEGISFACDYADRSDINKMHDLLGIKPVSTLGVYRPDYKIRQLIKNFLTEYKGKLIWHNAAYDLKVLVYTLWMDDYLDYKGMVEGIEVVTRNFDDTKLLTYLATNSCAGNSLGLKAQAHEFAGNYAEEEIDNICNIPLDKLLRYNLVDCLSTWYVYEKHNPTVDKDNQREIYDKLFIPCVAQMLQMELNGMPIDMDAVHRANRRLTRLHDVYYKFLQTKLDQTGYIQKLRWAEVEEYNTTRKKKRKWLHDFPFIELNPGSPKQLQDLLYGEWDLPVLDYTDTKQPATGTKTLKKLLKHTDDKDQQMIIRCVIHLSKVDKILQAFMPNFLNATPVSDGTHRLYGGFNLGGTASGRLSSSKPNLQQIPSGSTFGKLIKKCFKGPKGYVFGGADYQALEDVANSLLTHDPAKIAVWDQGFDGHCYRMVRYWPDQFTHIDINDVDQVNSTKDTHDPLRSKSKAPSFALQFQGTEHTLMNNCGFSAEEASTIYNNYHDMYAVSKEWTDEKLEEASKKGYVTLAYGLRLRTPIMERVVWGAPRMPQEAKAEGRTAGNAISGQSYGLINSRAAMELQKRINKSLWKYKIHICALIHDACYLLIPDDVDAVKWVNDNLVECMKNHGLPELDWHPNVKVGAELDLFYPNWSNAITLKNNLSTQQIRDKVNEKLSKLSNV